MLRACCRNASELIASSKLLLDQQRHAPALALSVLAIEEVGKLCAADGLLLAKPDDFKSTAFKRSLRDHTMKLERFTMLPFLIRNIARTDTLLKTDQSYARALAISLSYLKNLGNKVLSTNGMDGFAALDASKRSAFYVSIQDGKFLVPSEAIDPEKAAVVHELAWRAVTTLEFVLSDGNIERHFDMARRVRRTLTEADHLALEGAAEELARTLFSDGLADEAGQRPN